MQRERGSLALTRSNGPGNEKGEVEPGIMLNQCVNLPANDAAYAGGLAHRWCVIDYKLHSPLNVQSLFAAKFQNITTPMAKSLAEL